MKNLVIHPIDSTTDFLNAIYKNIENLTIIRENISKSKINDLIKANDRIIILGHGTDYGLLSSNFEKYVIDCRNIQFLKDKEVIGIWCNANIFAEKYDLKGLFSGMVISELSEAKDYNIHTNEYELLFENDNFAKNLSYCIQNYILKDIPKIFKTFNNTKTELCNFNYNSIFYF